MNHPSEREYAVNRLREIADAIERGGFGRVESDVTVSPAEWHHLITVRWAYPMSEREAFDKEEE